MKKIFAIVLTVVMLAGIAMMVSADEAKTYTAQLQYVSGAYCPDHSKPLNIDLTNSIGCYGSKKAQGTVSGPGTYTVSWAIADHSTKYDWDAVGTDMLFIQITDFWSDFNAAGYQIEDVKLLLDGVEIPLVEEYIYIYEAVTYVQLTNQYIYTDDLTIELYNYLGYSGGGYDDATTTYGQAIDPDSVFFKDTVAISFTIVDPNAPTTEPTTEPTVAPTTEPTVAPTTEPTVAPTTEPTVAPTTEPTVAPTTEPTVAPTTEATKAPEATTEATKAPSNTNAETGDSISMIVALLAVSAMGIVIVGKKKFD